MPTYTNFTGRATVADSLDMGRLGACMEGIKGIVWGGLAYWARLPKAVFCFWANGNVSIAGANSEGEMETAYQAFRQVLIDCGETLIPDTHSVLTGVLGVHNYNDGPWNLQALSECLIAAGQNVDYEPPPGPGTFPAVILRRATPGANGVVDLIFASSKCCITGAATIPEVTIAYDDLTALLAGCGLL